MKRFFDELIETVLINGVFLFIVTVLVAIVFGPPVLLSYVFLGRESDLFIGFGVFAWGLILVQYLKKRIKRIR